MIVKITTLGILLLVLCSTTAKAADPDKTVPPIAVSGDFEVDSISVTKRIATDAVVDADLLTMQLQLWLAEPVKPQGRTQYLIKITNFQPIEDNTGKLLSTPKRTKYYKFLQGEAEANQFKSARGKAGPVISMTLEVPERQATTIKSIKGTVQLSTTKAHRLLFDDLKSLQGKPLIDPQLADFPITPTIKVDQFGTELSLKVLPQHDRLKFWGLIKDGRPLDEKAEGKSEDVISKTYDGDQTNAKLGIVIEELTTTKEIPFKFKDVRLP